MSNDFDLDNLDIVFTGPFRTDIFLDFRYLTAVGYEGGQEKIMQAMASNPNYSCYDWHYPKLEPGQIYKSGNFGRGKTIIPRYYLGCTLSSSDLSEQTKHNFMINDELKEYGYEAEIVWIRLRMYEFGFGSFSACIKLQGEKSTICVEELQKISEKISDLIEKNEIELIAKIISSITAEFNTQINNFEIKQFPPIDTEFEISKKWGAAGEIMWTHRLFCYSSENGESFKILSEKINKILSPKGEVISADSKDFLGLGVANSAVICCQKSDSSRWEGSSENRGKNLLFESASRVLQAANVYYAVSQYLDNSLFWFFNYSVDRAREEKNIKKLRELEKEIIEHIQFSNQYTALLDQYKLYLNPTSKKMWDKIDDAWELHKRVQGLDKQIHNIIMLYDRITNEITASRQRMLNVTAVIFTGISAVALVEIAQAPGFRWPNASVFFIIAITVIIVILCVAVMGFFDFAKRWCCECWKKIRRKKP